MIKKLFEQVDTEGVKENPFVMDKKTREVRDAFEEKYIQPEVEREGTEDCFFAFHNVLQFERENAFSVGFSCAIKLITEAIGTMSEL